MTTMNGMKSGRPTLSGQIDRLDSMLDGLAEALNESVADAVRGVVGQTVRESVESAVRDVLADPALLREALARHGVAAQVAPAEGRTLARALGGTLSWLCALAAGKASDSGKVLGHGWSWALAKVRAPAEPLWGAAKAAASALPWLGGLAWRNRGTCAAALGVGTLVGVLAYLAGPVAASALCGLGGAAASLAGSALAPLWGLVAGRD